MKKWLLSGVVALLLPCAAVANTFIQGKHYDVIAEQVTAKPEVKEYFSFYCGGCYSFEPVVQQLARNLPADTEMKKVHVDFVRAASPEIQNLLTRAYIVANSLGKGDQVSMAIFNQIHRNRVPFRSEADVRSLLAIHDIDGDTFDKSMRSFSVMGAARQMMREQEDLSNRRVLTGVPMLVVNGKYRIINEGLNQRNLQQDLQQLVDYLLAKDA